VEHEVHVSGQDDSESDDVQEYLVLGGPSQSNDPLYTGHSFNLTMYNRDNDVAALVVQQNGQAFSGLGLPVDEAGQKQIFEVKLPNPPEDVVIVSVVSEDLTEGTVDKERLVFTPENYAVWQPIEITGIDDDEQDGNIQFQVTLTCSSTDERYSNIVWYFVMMNNDDDNLEFDKQSCIISESGDRCNVAMRNLQWYVTEKLRSSTFNYC
jgi:hypothetical protein